jgi:predicted transcriptional regulator
LQSEVETVFGFSRSHVSETISEMEASGRILSRREGRLVRKIWSAEFFPFSVPGKVRIGLLRSSEYIQYIGVALNVCDSHELDLILRFFNSSSDVMDSLMAGSIDIALAPLYTQIMYSVVTRKIKIVTSIASGGSSIFRNGNTESRKLGTSETSTMILLSRGFFGKLEGNVEIYADPEEAMDNIKRGFYGYISIWEPYCTILRAQEDLEEIATYENVLEDMPCCVSSFKNSGEGTVKEIITEVDNLYNSGAEAKSEYVRKAIYIFSSRLGLSEKIIEESLKSYHKCRRIDRNQIVSYMDMLKIPVSHTRIDDMLI